jgi:microcystin-dependent protein
MVAGLETLFLFNSPRSREGQMPVIFKNNAASTLAVQAQLSDTSITVANGTGNRFPTPAAGEWFYATIQLGVNYEIVKCTARAGDVLTVDRAQDDTLARLWGVGASIDMRIPKILLESFFQTVTASQSVLELLQADTEAEARAALGATITGDAIYTAPDPETVRSLIYAAAADKAVPTGVIMPYAGVVAPEGWLLCAGQSVSRATYPFLFAVLQTLYGSDDENSFTLPDLRGRSVFGKDDMGGTAAGRVTAAVSGVNGTMLGAAGGAQLSGDTTLTVDQMPSHTHNGTASSNGDHQHGTAGPQLPNGPSNGINSTGNYGNSNNYNLTGGGTAQYFTSTNGAHDHTVNISAIGGGQPHNHTALPPAIILNYIIKT